MKFRIFCVAAFNCMLISCGQGLVTPAESERPTFRVEDTSPNGYLDLGILFNKVRKFPDGTVARQFTRSVHVEGSTRDTFSMRLYKGGFSFEDLAAKDTDLIKDYETAAQTGCDIGSVVTLSTHDGVSDNFEITSCSPHQITIQEQASPNTRYSFQLLSPLSLQLTKRFEAMDVCFNATQDSPRQNPIVETVRVIKWGEASDIQSNEETVSYEMLQWLVRGSVSVPDSLVYLSQDATGELSVPTNDLKVLNDSRLKPEADLCPGLHPRPSSETPSGAGSSEGAPEPDYPTAPGNTPETVPVPTPAPTPSSLIR